MNKVMRYQIADYINTSATETPAFSLMGVGFNALDENPNAQLDQKTYIHQKDQSSSIKGYQTQFPFDTDLIADDDAVMILYGVGRDHLTGAAAEFDYIRVDLYDPEATASTFPARKFKVAVEVSSFAGEGGGVVKATGNLNVVGDFVEGTFNTSTKTFTATA